METRTRLWREYYLVAHYALGNTTALLLPGSSSQFKVGMRGFHVAGLETMVTYDFEQESDDGENGGKKNDRTTSHITGQLHLYF